MKPYIRCLLSCATLTLTLCSCLAPAQTKVTGSNPNVRVELLFEADGCKIYRFYDRGAVRYFTKCQNGSSSIGWLESCGKNCVYYAENITSYSKNGLPVQP